MVPQRWSLIFSTVALWRGYDCPAVPHGGGSWEISFPKGRKNTHEAPLRPSPQAQQENVQTSLDRLVRSHRPKCLQGSKRPGAQDTHFGINFPPKKELDAGAFFQSLCVFKIYSSHVLGEKKSSLQV